MRELFPKTGKWKFNKIKIISSETREVTSCSLLKTTEHICCCFCLMKKNRLIRLKAASFWSQELWIFFVLAFNTLPCWYLTQNLVSHNKCVLTGFSFDLLLQFSDSALSVVVVVVELLGPPFSFCVVFVLKLPGKYNATWTSLTRLSRLPTHCIVLFHFPKAIKLTVLSMIIWMKSNFHDKSWSATLSNCQTKSCHIFAIKWVLKLKKKVKWTAFIEPFQLCTPLRTFSTESHRRIHTLTTNRSVAICFSVFFCVCRQHKLPPFLYNPSERRSKHIALPKVWLSALPLIHYLILHVEGEISLSVKQNL